MGLAAVLPAATANAAPPTPLTWDSADDFRVAPNQANPSPDSYGNAGVWAYVENTGALTDPSTYALLPVFDDSFLDPPDIDAWRDSQADSNGGSPFLPYVAYNGSGTDRTFCATGPSPPVCTHEAGDIAVHPSPTRNAIIRWTSPFDGGVRVSGNVANHDMRGGNGIRWSLRNHSGASMAGAELMPGFASGFGASTADVEVGDSYYLAIDANGEALNDVTMANLVVEQKFDTVTGSGSIARNNTFEFDVWSDPDGDDAGGTIKFQTAGSTIEGAVECVGMSFDRAIIVYSDTDPPANPAGTVGGIIRVRDGSPDRQKNGRLTLKQLNAYRTNGCAFPPDVALNAIHSGTIAVDDE